MERRVNGRYGLEVMTSPEKIGETSHEIFKDEDNPAVSVILTVINEEKHLEAAVQAVLSSSYKGEIEIIIAVGPSFDGTREIAESLKLRDERVHIIDNPTGRTPDGLNAALKKSRFQIIVRIDGHSEIERTYIETAVRTLRETGAVNAGGLMAAEGISKFQRAVARAMRSPIGVGASRFHTGGSAGPTDTVYLGVFLKRAVEEVGGYDRNFIRAQDWEMNFRLRLKGGIVWFNPELKVTYRPRSTIRSLARQYFEYGRWRRVVSRSHKGTLNFRYLAPPLNLIAVLLSFFAGLFLHPYFFFFLGIYISVILFASFLLGDDWSERSLLPIVLMVMHFCWGFGFITSPRRIVPSH